MPWAGNTWCRGTTLRHYPMRAWPHRQGAITSLSARARVGMPLLLRSHVAHPALRGHAPTVMEPLPPSML